MHSRATVFAVATGCLLTGCLGVSVDPVAPAPSPQATLAAFPVDRLIGNWGVASFREAKDQARTEARAREACKLPYVITKGPTDGVMMYVADDTDKHELKLKGGPGGKTYLGFEGPPGDDQDREILSFSDKEFVARFVNPETNARYGTFVFVRCSSARA